MKVRLESISGTLAGQAGTQNSTGTRGILYGHKQYSNKNNLLLYHLWYGPTCLNASKLGGVGAS